MKYFIEVKAIRQRTGGEVHISFSPEKCWPLCDVDAESYDYIYVDLPVNCKSCLAILPLCGRIEDD